MRRDAALLLATVALGSALSGMGSAQAGVSIVVTGAAGPVAPTDATALQVHRGGGSGHMALIPYYSTQGGNSTLINITNTDEVNGKAVKVRFRGAINADTVYNFTVLLGPADVWSANVSQGADGRSVLTTSDASLTLPANVNGSFLTDRLPTDSAAAQRAEWTREGYVEIITMADIGPSYNCLVITGSPYPRENPLFDAISINAGQEVQSCATNPSIASALNSLATAPASELAAYALGLDAPSSGLLVNSMIVNVFDASVAWTTPTTSLTVVNAAGEPASICTPTILCCELWPAAVSARLRRSNTTCPICQRPTWTLPPTQAISRSSMLKRCRPHWPSRRCAMSIFSTLPSSLTPIGH